MQKVLTLTLAVAMLAAVVCAADPTPPSLPNQWSAEIIFDTGVSSTVGMIYYDFEAQMTRTDMIQPGLMISQFVNYTANKPTGYPLDVFTVPSAGNNAMCQKDGSPADDLFAQNVFAGFAFVGQTSFMGQYCNEFSANANGQVTSVYFSVESDDIVALTEFNETTGESQSLLAFLYPSAAPIPASTFTLPSICSTTALAADAKPHPAAAAVRSAVAAIASLFAR